jgi:hypothetical protein
LCENITRFLVLKPFYQNIVYDDEKDMCAMLFEDNHTGITPFSYCVDNAPLSVDERRIHGAWRTHTRYEFFAVEKVTPGKELDVTGLSGEHRYRV